MDFSTYPETLKLDLANGVLTVTLNNPGQMNAVLPSMDDNLARIFFEADNDDRTKVIVLTGAGKAFCAGGDIAGMQAGVDNIQNFIDGYRNGKRFMQMMLDCDKPIVAKVNGDAIGLGCTLALCADIVVAAEHARFADPHVKVGLAAGDGGAVFWPSNIGFAQAKYFLMTGDLIGARDAQAMGLIAKVASAEDLEAETAKVVGKLVNGAAMAIRYSKAVLNIPLRQRLAAMVDAGFALETLTSRLPDHREACDAFVAKRKPNFGKI
jgi:enoyl-CoA hydratase